MVQVELRSQTADVAVLHEIVRQAQQLFPSLPLRERLPTTALFNAYYDILPQLGIDADHDNRYARVLFKIGGLREPGTLYEKFEEVMSRKGIQIELDPDADDSGQDGDIFIDTDAAIVGDDTHYQDEATPGRKRRNSESSAWDLGHELESKSRRRRGSFEGTPARKETEGPQYSVPKLFQPSPAPRASAPLANQNQPANNVRTWLESKQDGAGRQRGRSVSTHGSLRIRRRSPSVIRGRKPSSASVSDENRAPSEFTALTSVTDRNEVDDPSLKAAPSKADRNMLETRAVLIRQHRLGFVLIRKLRLWRDTAVQRANHHQNLERLAGRKDKLALLNQAWITWRECLQKKQLVKDDEKRSEEKKRRAKEEQRKAEDEQRHWANLEHRTTNLYDCYLKQKVLSHWLRSASEKKQLTSVARRHILRTRVFNAWRALTVANEIKVRRQRLKKFFSAWKRQIDFNSYNLDKANRVYDGNLIRNVFQQWFREHLAMMFVSRQEENSKYKALQVWASAVQSIQQNCRMAKEERLLRLIWDAWQVWKARTEDQNKQTQDADAFYNAKVCRSMLRKWRRETQVIPAKKIIRTDLNSRLLRDTFSTWLYRTRQQRKAAQVDRCRILREAWTNWRLKVRRKRFQAIKEHRCLTENFRLLALEGQSIVFRKRKDEELAYQCLQTWFEELSTSTEKRLDQEARAEDYDRRKTLGMALKAWYARMSGLQETKTTAADFRGSRLAVRTLSGWSEKARHVQEMEGWSREARFYFLASTMLKKWRASNETAKREKRKSAYAQVRKTNKMNLARGFLVQWRDQARHVISLRAQATEAARNRTVIIGMEVFDRWRARTEELNELEPIWHEVVLRKFISLWQERSAAYQLLDTEAAADFEERRQDRALRKWSLRALQFRSMSNSATEVRERNHKKSFRRIFTYWQQRAAQKRPPVRPSTPPFNQTARDENWSDFGDEVDMDEITRGLHENYPTTPLPGYMASPSKRIERVSAVALRFNSTTPRVPLSTPHERQLRAEYGKGSQSDGRISYGARFDKSLVPPRRRPLGRSMLGLDRGFPDIPEGSMNSQDGV